MMEWEHALWLFHISKIFLLENKFKNSNLQSIAYFMEVTPLKDINYT